VNTIVDTPDRTLSLGEDLHPPAELLLERGFVAGAPRTGKTNTCVVLVEEADRLGSRRSSSPQRRLARAA
jgi:hypothetical protein